MTTSTASASSVRQAVGDRQGAGASPAWSSALSSLDPANRAAIERIASTPAAPAEPFDSLTHKAQAAVAIFLYEQPYVTATDDAGSLQAGHSSGGTAAIPIPLDWFPPHTRPNLNNDNTASGVKDAVQKTASSKVLHVLMTTRALHLRSHPGQASLPGGKKDTGDRSIEHTALRESVEEVGMSGIASLNKEVHWLYTGAPLLSKTCLLVHPVVFFLSNPAKTLSQLKANPSEVSALWSVPLPTFLGSSDIPPGYTLADPLIVDTHRPPQHALRTYSDVPWLLGRSYRLHRFRSNQQLVKGLTADNLIQLASIAYGQPPRFEVRAEGQMGWEEMVDVVLARLKDGRRGESRWGDGESGDAQGSTEAYPTIVGVDLSSSGKEAEVNAEEGLVVEEEEGQPARQRQENTAALASSLQKQQTHEEQEINP
ncbi:hypothetical protein OC846_004004 [Tilletia horrida]|uniref:Nudix hydrolase domain-containing protein n=1 Tax=Tilletia horrida TaxID=155126 RepID=A0AAN6GNZ8_9BASI|nr:hypothetical protein OC845_005097 [Tilletia horrida]KAK0549585.1 hypothetical protein OC846_004004 [Tilletia horrida]KAK0564244.1 hypothetical protein OC861_004392 [Tilletia horrida]